MFHLQQLSIFSNLVSSITLTHKFEMLNVGVSKSWIKILIRTGQSPPQRPTPKTDLHQVTWTLGYHY